MTLKALIALPALVMTVAALMLPAPAARAIPMPFGGILSSANEVPPVINSDGAGSAVVVRWTRRPKQYKSSHHILA
jgi:hypothetical protein